MRTFSLLTMSLWFAIGCTGVMSDDNGVDYPTNYRSWQHVKSMVILPGHPLEKPFGGIHHIYANTKAMAGLTGGQYQDGAIFVFDLLAYDDGNMTLVETQRTRLDVMQFDRRRYASTGGWGYETFVGDSKTQRLQQDVEQACAACHSAAESSHYVFSKYRP